MNRYITWIRASLAVFFVALFASHLAVAQDIKQGDKIKDIEINVEGRLVIGRKYRKKPLTLTVKGFDDKPIAAFKGPITVTSGGKAIVELLPNPVNGVYTIKGWTVHGDDILVKYKGRPFKKDLVVASWLSLLPPILAIALALWFRQVLISLFGGIWLGHAVITLTTPGHDGTQFIIDLFGFLPALSETLVGALADGDHAKIIVFTLLMGGMVGLISAAGAMTAIVEIISKKARTPRSAQVATWLMGICIFFDDYANTILVGNTMRPFTDSYRISREKLAYIVDSTAAPVAALFLVSTWIGYEVGLIDTMLGFGLPGEAYDTFISSIPYRFYSILCLFMVFLVASTGRDFGPMLRAEQRARHEGKVLADGAKPLLDTESLTHIEGKKKGTWWLAALPVGTLVTSILFFLLWTGFGPAQANGRAQLVKASKIVAINADEFESFPKLWTAVSNEALKDQLTEKESKKWRYLLSEAKRQSGLSGILSEASSYNALVWGAGLSVLLAFLLTLGGGFLTLEDTLKAFVEGLKAMMLAVVVLLLAWSLGKVCEHLATGEFLAEQVSFVNGSLLPSLVFILSALIAFSTGTSWGTMAIVFPVLGPLLALSLDHPHFESIMLGSVGAVLAGACFGDHASPISDTTVLSSMSSGSDHIDHVRTQLPYAAHCAGLAVVFGFLPAGFGISPWIGLVLGSVSLIATLMIFGKKADDPPSDGVAVTGAAGKPEETNEAAEAETNEAGTKE